MSSVMRSRCVLLNWSLSRKVMLWGQENLVKPQDLDNGSSNESSNEKEYAHGSKHLKQQKGTSLQITEEKESDAKARADIIREFSLEGPLADRESLHEEGIVHNADMDTRVPLLLSEVKEILKLLWKNEARLFACISDIMRQCLGQKADPSMFFLETLLVPPIKFRPSSKGGGSIHSNLNPNTSHEKNLNNLNTIPVFFSCFLYTIYAEAAIQANIDLGNAHVNKLGSLKIIRRWMNLQQYINVMFDSKKAAGQENVPPGICQLLKRKGGLFRQKMMGKMVNFSCRSVKSPDPYLAVNEIGIPPYFAFRLTYPEERLHISTARVTPWNAVKLRNAIANGPEVHPGATHYADKLSTVKLPPSRKARISISRKLLSSRGVVRNGKNSDYELEGKNVNLHLQDGDIVLVNRQDHVVSALLITKKDTFLRRDEFNQLLYSFGLSTPGSGASFTEFGTKVCELGFEAEFQSLLPETRASLDRQTGDYYLIS
ncbi:hypothetical protein TIFTF001_023913 [Ficus carica]|uniref:DNA-directed RNA polymerase n=1 Tax=Ficus carica TaxID=3494 RepID=A0AA88AXE8_FICCA|nr:hypothetical protein TIFTF001_023913 [Ficus carica]